MGFAAGVPGTGRHPPQAGPGTGYGMIECAWSGTHCKDRAVRLLCPAHSAAFLNVWVPADAVPAYMTGIHADDPPATQQHPKDAVPQYRISCHRMPPEPPHAALPQGASAKTAVTRSYITGLFVMSRLGMMAVEG